MLVTWMRVLWREPPAAGAAVPSVTRAVLALCPLRGPPPKARAAVAGGSGTITIIITPGGHPEPDPTLHGYSGPIRALCLITQPGGGRCWPPQETTPPSASGTCPSPTPAHREASTCPLPACPAASPVTLAGSGHWPRSRPRPAPRPAWPLPAPTTPSASGTRSPAAAAASHSPGTPTRSGPSSPPPATTTATSWCLAGTTERYDSGPPHGHTRPSHPLGIPVHAILQQRPDPASRERRLLLVETLSTRWDFFAHQHGGKVVWAALDMA